MSRSTSAFARKPATYVATYESNKALKLLLGARNDEGISPQGVIAPSACQLLVRNGWSEGRASYMLHLLVECNIIRRVDHSYKYEILRPDLYVTDFPEPKPQRAVPTPRDLAPRFVAARENTDLMLLQRKLKEAQALADAIGKDRDKIRKENERLKGTLTHIQDQSSGADSRALEAEARAESAEARANELQEQLNEATQLLERFRAYKSEVDTLVGMFPKL